MQPCTHRDALIYSIMKRNALIVVIAALWTTLAAAQGEYIDDLGRSIVLQSPAQRIVSLAPSITETLFAVGAGGQVVGVTDYCDYPPEARDKQSIGGMIGPSVEMIISLEPDLIIVTPEGNAQESFRQIRDIGVPVFVTNPRSLEGIYKSIHDLGQLAGRTDEAAAVISTMRAAEDSLKLMTGVKVSILLIISVQPLIVAGTGTFLAEMIELGGGENVAAKSGLSYPTFSREQVVASDPAVIILTADIPGKREVLSLYPEWQQVAAFRTGRVHEMDPNLASRPGPSCAARPGPQ